MEGLPEHAANGLRLCEEADFEALNCLPALNLIRSTKFQLTTEPAFLPNACYVPYFFVFLSFKVKDNWKNESHNYCPNAINW